MKKALLLLLASQPALSHDGHGAATLFHMHGGELLALGLAALVCVGAPGAYRAWQRSRRR